MPPLLMSIWVVGLCAVSGSASCSFREVEFDVLEVMVGLPFGFTFDSAVALMLNDRKVKTARAGRMNGLRFAKDRTRNCMC